MPTQLGVQLSLTLAWQYLQALDLSNVRDAGARNFDDALVQGTGLDQADLLWHDRRTLAGGASEELDLTGGLTASVSGAALTFARVKGIVLKNRSLATDATLSVGGAASQAFSACFGAGDDVLKIGPDGLVVLWNPSAAGYAVTDGSSDRLKFAAAGAGSLEYDVLIFGASS